MMKQLSITILVILAFIGGCVVDGLITRVPPDASTSGRLMRLKHDIISFYESNMILPESLDALEMPGSVSSRSIPKCNAWGGPIVYSVSNGTIVTIRTYGPGGADAEVRQEFTVTFDVNSKKEYVR